VGYMSVCSFQGWMVLSLLAEIHCMWEYDPTKVFFSMDSCSLHEFTHTARA